MGRCIRCGREGHMEYGSDGQAYCGSCVFYGMNKPCWRCGMYVPASELQQYKGQWMCPICIGDARAADARVSYKEPTYKKNDYPMQVHSYEETCEKCGRTLVTVYILNGKKLCWTCLHEEQDKWTIVGGEKPPTVPMKMTVEAQRKSALRKFFEHVFSEFLALFGVRWKPREPVSQVVALKATQSKRPRRSFGRPMVSGMRKEREDAVPSTEGIIKGKPKTPRKKSSDVTFPEYQKKDKKKDKK
ncbi:MAG: hypothetical protein ABII71_02120 [Candidatus Micrarchaeota archaeon]